jgi:tRNA A37 methylthiotransferase MiaB
MNYHDGERISGLLEADGYTPAASESEADLIVVNTCSVPRAGRPQTQIEARRDSHDRRRAGQGADDRG